MTHPFLQVISCYIGAIKKATALKIDARFCSRILKPRPGIGQGPTQTGQDASITSHAGPIRAGSRY